MWKKALLALTLIATTPLLVHCAASGAGSVGADEDGASGSATGSVSGGDSKSTSKSTTDTDN